MLPSPACSTRDTLSPHLYFHDHCSSGQFEPGTQAFLLLCAAETEDMLAWDHSAVDQDWFEAFVAAVDHWVHNLLSNQVNLRYKVQFKWMIH